MHGWISTLVIFVLLLSACNKKSSNVETTAEEQAVVNQSAFYPGEVAPQMAAALGDTGFIPVGTSPASNDTGFIPSSTPSSGATGSSSPTGESVAASGTSANNEGTISTSPVATSSSATTSEESTTVISSNDTAGASPSSSTPNLAGVIATGDSGNISQSSGNTGNDSGNIQNGSVSTGELSGTETSSTGTATGSSPGNAPENSSSVADTGALVSNTGASGEGVGSTSSSGGSSTTSGTSSGTSSDSGPQGTNGTNESGTSNNSSSSSQVNNSGGSHDNDHACSSNHHSGDGSRSHAKCLCSCQSAHSACQTKNKIGITLSRVCSIRRSQSDSLFFEEAKRPWLSIEALTPTCSPAVQGHQLASVGLLPYLNSTLKTQANAVTQWGSLRLKSVDLSNVNLFDGRYKTSIDLDISKMKETFGQLKWRQVAINAIVCDDVNGDRFCSNEDAKHTLSVTSPRFSVGTLPSKLLIDVWHGRYLTKKEDPELCEKQYSPLVLDLNGDGIRLSGPESGVRFDLNDDGNSVLTGWTSGADEAFLVRDLNHNGQIDSGAEMFGSATKLKSGARAANGFVALQELDSNGDGKFTSEDREWNNLLLWVDANHNARVDKGELQSFSKYAVSSINLKYTEMMEVDPFGNQTRERTTFTRRVKGIDKAYLMVDVWFNTLVELSSN